VHTLSSVFCLAIAAALAGCGEQNRIASDFTPAADRVATSADDSGTSISPAVALPATVPSAKPPASPGASTLAAELETSFRSFPGYILAGTARLRPEGRQTLVTVTLTGGVSQRNYVGALQLGRCDRPGPALHQLVEVSADTTGIGRAVSSVPIRFDSLVALSTVLVYGTGGRSETCAGVGGGAVRAP